MATDEHFHDVVLGCMGLIVIIIVAVRLVEIFNSHLRRISAMTSPLLVDHANQHYWAINATSWFPWIKKHYIYAPLGKKRHNREIRLSSAMHIGTVPSRFQAVLILAYFFANLLACLYLDYSSGSAYTIVGELRARSGDLAVANMVPMILLAGRNNPLISTLKISFDAYNCLHRWTGRMVALMSVVHTGAWAYCEWTKVGTTGTWDAIWVKPLYYYGAIGTIASIVLILHAASPLRHAFYETFLNLHIALAAVFIAMVWLHCDLGSFPQLVYVKAAVGLWVADRVFRFARLAYFNWQSGREGFTKATVEALPGDTCRVTLHLPRYAHIKPGSHAYLRFFKLNAWESHPFSIAWVRHVSSQYGLPPPVSEKGPVKAEREQLRTEVSFVITAQTGMTRKLYDLAASSHGIPITLRAAFEGPYGGHHGLDSYGHAVLFAAATGIAHQVSYLLPLISDYSKYKVATRRITLVWVVRKAAYVEWVQPWMNEVLKLPGRRDILRLQVFVTQPTSPIELHSPSSTVKMIPGRPNIAHIMEQEVSQQVGAMAVSVCGPGGFADDVRSAVRSHVEKNVLDFFEESFTW